MEKRVIIVLIVSFLILMLWYKLFPPPQVETPAVEEQKSKVEVAMPEEETTVKAKANGDLFKPLQGYKERSFTFANEEVEVQWTNRGGVMTQWKLLNHFTDKGEPIVLFPQGALRIHFPENPALTQMVQEVLFKAEVQGNKIILAYANPQVWIRKTFEFQEKSLASLTIEVDTLEVSHWYVEVPAGFRILDEAEKKNRFLTNADGVIFLNQKLKRIPAKKVKEVLTYERIKPYFFGIEDRYFAGIFYKPSLLGKIQYVAQGEDLAIRIYPEKKKIQAKLFINAKDYQRLKKIDPALGSLVNFGFFSILAKPMLVILNFLYSKIHNYGIAIILLTLLLRILLYPLNHKQLKSMKRMQKIQPMVERIKAKYKKAKADVAQRAKMNQEIMELYRQEGVNPMGGCLPMIIQIPILWAFYNLLSAAIELRHAPFILWIQDLSARDPYFITPILMGVAMLIQQLITPTGTAQQRKTFLIMPIVLTFLFANFPSGLVLYWLTNNLFQIAQALIYQKLEQEVS